MIGSSISMKLAYQTENQTIKWPIIFSVFVEHDFVVNKTYTSRSAEKNRFESLMLQISIIQIENFWYSISKFIICSCIRHCMTSMTFVKSLRNTHWTHTEYDCSVYFDMQISWTLKIQLINV